MTTETMTVHEGLCELKMLNKRIISHIFESFNGEKRIFCKLGGCGRAATKYGRLPKFAAVFCAKF